MVEHGTMNKEPDLTTLLMAISFLHVYRDITTKEDLCLLLGIDKYKNSLMLVPYENEFYTPPMTREVQHMIRILKAHELAYKELLCQF